jgi:hypothetical protein
LRVVSGLSVGIEINFINAGLPPGAWLGVPYIRAALNLAEFLHGETAPAAHSSWHYRQAAGAASSKLIAERIEPT